MWEGEREGERGRRGRTKGPDWSAERTRTEDDGDGVDETGSAEAHTRRKKGRDVREVANQEAREAHDEERFVCVVELESDVAAGAEQEAHADEQRVLRRLAQRHGDR